MLSEILVDNITLRRHVSLLVHPALKAGIVTAKDMESLEKKSLDDTR